MSYSIDVYRQDVKTEHNIIDFGAYVVMFPQLIAGPIVKYRDVSNQLHVYAGRITLGRIEQGVSLFVFGLAKKVLLADAIGQLWTDIIGVKVPPRPPSAWPTPPPCWSGWALSPIPLQLYFDFSGYSMMGIGMGKNAGFRFPDNFNLPLHLPQHHRILAPLAHDPLGVVPGIRPTSPWAATGRGKARQIFNLFIVWLLTGIWHGANWNFICWGLYYFVLLMIEKLFLLPYLEKGKRSGPMCTPCFWSWSAGPCLWAMSTA